MAISRTDIRDATSNQHTFSFLEAPAHRIDMFEDAFQYYNMLRLVRDRQFLRVSVEHSALIAEMSSCGGNESWDWLDATDVESHLSQNANRLRPRSATHHEKILPSPDVSEAIQVAQDHMHAGHIV
jgi:hypothetical protein